MYPSSRGANPHDSFRWYGHAAVAGVAGGLSQAVHSAGGWRDADREDLSPGRRRGGGAGAGRRRGFGLTAGAGSDNTK